MKGGNLSSIEFVTEVRIPLANKLVSDHVTQEAIIERL